MFRRINIERGEWLRMLCNNDLSDYQKQALKQLDS